MQETNNQVEIVMPQLAESLVSATIGKWLKQPGDYIERYEPICEVITDKVNAELPSTIEGVLKQILVEAGDTVPVGMAICIVELQGQSAVAQQPSGNQTESANAAASAPATAVPAQHAEGHEAGRVARSRYSPAVHSLAEEHGIDLRQVTGTGLEGRVTRKDVLQYIESGAHKQPAAAVAANSLPSTGAPATAQTGGLSAPPVAPNIPVRSSGIHLSESPRTPLIEVEGQADSGRGEYFIDVTPIRNTIASRTRQSVTEIPHAWTMIEVDVTNLVLLRNKLKDEFKRNEGFNLTYLAFLIKAVVNAIKDYPIMNSVWAVDKIIVKRDINISVLVGTEDSVLSPVIKKADQKNIAGLAREVDDLARRTREGKLSPSDMTGGTFTVNNTGSFGSILSYPIINYPQAAILTFESIVKRPVVINEMIAVRSMANLCLSLDHRILDGVICGRFLQRVKENVESYTLDTKLY